MAHGDVKEEFLPCLDALLCSGAGEALGACLASFKSIKTQAASLGVS